MIDMMPQYIRKRARLQLISDLACSISPGKPILISPLFSSSLRFPRTDRKNLSAAEPRVRTPSRMAGFEEAIINNY
jgi:hypothetical protein